MKECRNLTVRHFKSSNVLAWRSLLVTETIRVTRAEGRRPPDGTDVYVTMDIDFNTCTSPVHRRLSAAKFSKSTIVEIAHVTLTTPTHETLTHHKTKTRLRRLHMADPCTKFEVSSVSRCGDITWGVKFLNGSPDPVHAPFREDFSSAGWISTSTRR